MTYYIRLIKVKEISKREKKEYFQVTIGYFTLYLKKLKRKTTSKRTPKNKQNSVAGSKVAVFVYSRPKPKNWIVLGSCSLSTTETSR